MEGGAAGIAVKGGLMLIDCSAYGACWPPRHSDDELEKASVARNCELCNDGPKLKSLPGDLTTFVIPRLMGRIYIHTASFVNLGWRLVPLVDKI